MPFVTPTAIDFVSKRVGNFQRHPFYGTLISQLWVDEGALELSTGGFAYAA